MSFYICGAGGFGRETHDALRAMSSLSAAEAVFLDDHVPAAEVDGVRVAQPLEVAPGPFVIAIADPDTRSRLARALVQRGFRPARVIHPRAVVSPAAALGPGAVVLANAYISTGTVLGEHVHINYNVTVGHDTVLADFVTVLPGANVAGAVTLGASVTVGSNASILPRLRIGAGTTVGAGAVVTRDQPPGLVVAGVPARQLRREAPLPRT